MNKMEHLATMNKSGTLEDENVDNLTLN